MNVVGLLAAALLLHGASARTQAFQLGGYHASPLMQQWAEESQMPLPATQVSVSFGGPAEYDPNSIYLPSCCAGGWTHHAIQGLFFHELGHVYDATSMTPALRRRFEALLGLPSWPWHNPIRTVRWVVGPDYIIKIAPSEIFAEEYAACSLGLTQLQYQEASYNTYGWVPPQGTNEVALCNWMRLV